MAVKRSWSSSAGLAAVLVLMAGGAAVAEKPVVQCDVLTVLELFPEGLRRLDVILYDVRSGSIDEFVLQLPSGLKIDRTETDESTGMASGGRGTLYRRYPLQGAGHLLVVSRPTSLPADEIPIGPVKPEAEVRARYLAISSLVPADLRLLPEASGTRVNMTDLPAAFSKALAFIDRTMVWRLTGDEEGARLVVTPLPFAPMRDAIIRRRDTTTLIDRQGTLLFFDRFLVDVENRTTTTLEVALPPGCELWAVRVNGVSELNPQERMGVVSVQLSGATQAVVEVVSVQEREGLPPGRSQLVLDLPRVSEPVLVHRLRLLLPDNASYRIRRGDLQAILPSTSALTKEFEFDADSGCSCGAVYIGPGHLSDGSARLYVKVTDNQGSSLPRVGIILKKGDATKYTSTNAFGVAVLDVPGDEYQLEAKREGFFRVEFPSLQLIDGKSLGLDLALSPGAVETITTQAASLRPLAAGEFQKEIDRLLKRLKGLFGKMESIPVAIPDDGKVLAFTGVLPPPRVTVELDVRTKK